MRQLHKMIQAASECGMVIRQELVSMLPPLFLDIKSSDMVLDMCAAPGSKTSQILEMLSIDFERNREANLAKGIIEVQGGVVANDMSLKRASMLTHRVKLINTTGMAVINHQGQNIPDIQDSVTKESILYDKVMVDVPCSGDGAIRKLPSRWRKWNSKDGMELHPVQIKLLERAIQLTKVGGTIVYSTCSLNPIENEAVIAEVLNRAKTHSPDPENSLEIVDIHGQLNGLKARRGLHYWDVLRMKRGGPHSYSTKLEDTTTGQLFDLFKGTGRGDELKLTKNGENVEESGVVLPAVLAESMFPLTKESMEQNHIEYGMRIMPHDQDTGGFFVAKFIKKGEVRFSPQTAEITEKKTSEAQVEQVAAKKEYMKFGELDKEGCDGIIDYYGIDEVRNPYYISALLI